MREACDSPAKIFQDCEVARIAVRKSALFRRDLERSALPCSDLTTNFALPTVPR
jgi:hypothetical protein